jgi:tetratricopeptide (TPR) repeat protein
MQRRFRAASLVALAALSLSLIGCGEMNKLKARKAFKEANTFYVQQDYKKAAERYQQVITDDPEFTTAYFYLANSLDNLYKPSRKGEKQNDEYLTEAVKYYKIAAEREKDPKQKKLALDFLLAAYQPDKLADPSQAEPLVQKMIEMDPGDPNNYFALAKIYEDAGQYDQAEQILLKAKDMRPKDPQVYGQLAGYYNRQGEFEKTIEAYQQWAQIEPNNPEVYYTMAAFYWEKAFRDTKLKEAQKKDYVQKGLEAVDTALKLKPDYMEALTSKGLLLRLQAGFEKDRAKYDAIIAEANTYTDRAKDIQKKKAAGLVK